MDKNDFRTLIKINGARNLGFNLEGKIEILK